MESTRVPPQHQRELLAQSAACQLERCCCGTYQVTVGPITFRVQPEMLEELWAVLGRGVTRGQHAGLA